MYKKIVHIKDYNEMKIELLFLKLRIIKITPKRILNWAKTRDLDLITYAVNHSDYKCRNEIAKSLAKFKYKKIESILYALLYDKVSLVVESTISTFNKFDLTKEVEKEIESVRLSWEKKNNEIKKNWSSLKSNHQGLYIDRTKMKRLKELKNLMGKFKSSMSVG